jgi:hypothetical protein
MEVGEQGIGYVSKAGRVGPVRVLTITAYAQDLGTLLLELGIILPEGGDLVRSPAGEIEDVERKHHVLLAPVLAQGDVVSQAGGHLEIGSWLSHLCCHVATS